MTTTRGSNAQTRNREANTPKDNKTLPGPRPITPTGTWGSSVYRPEEKTPETKPTVTVKQNNQEFLNSNLYNPWPDSSWQWNLPPHNWSRVGTIAKKYIRDEVTKSSAGSRAGEAARNGQEPKATVSTMGHIKRQASQGTYNLTPRRGAIWFNNAAKNNLEEGIADALLPGKDKILKEKTGDPDISYSLDTYERALAREQNDFNLRKYGFMFLWNPSEIAMTTNLDQSATVPALDQHLLMLPGTPGTQYMGITLMISRQDDMVAIRRHIPNKYPHLVKPEDVPDALVQEYKGEYLTLGDTYMDPSETNRFTRPSSKEDKEKELARFKEKISEVAHRGTLHDIDYIFKTVNGPGWKRWGVGDRIADVGRLYSTMVGISLGPMLYQGIIQDVSVEHRQFTNNMTPILSIVNISLNLWATAPLNKEMAAKENDVFDNSGVQTPEQTKKEEDKAILEINEASAYIKLIQDYFDDAPDLYTDLTLKKILEGSASVQDAINKVRIETGAGIEIWDPKDNWRSKFRLMIEILKGKITDSKFDPGGSVGPVNIPGRTLSPEVVERIKTYNYTSKFTPAS